MVLEVVVAEGGYPHGSKLDFVHLTCAGQQVMKANT